MMQEPNDFTKRPAHGALSVLAAVFLLVLFVVLGVLAFLYLRRGFGPARDFTPPAPGVPPGLDGGSAALLLGAALFVFLLLGAGLLLLATLLCCCKGRRPGLGPLALPVCALFEALKATATALEVSGAALETARQNLGQAGAELQSANDMWFQHMRVPAPAFPGVRRLSEYGVVIPPGLPDPFVLTGEFGTTDIEIPGSYFFRVGITNVATKLKDVGQMADAMTPLADHMKELQGDAVTALRHVARLLEPLCLEEKKKLEGKG